MDNMYINKNLYTDPNLVKIMGAMNDAYYVDFNNITSIINYVINHYEKFLLLLFVFILIWSIDYITNINTLLYGTAPIPFLPSSSTNIQPQAPAIKKSKKK